MTKLEYWKSVQDGDFIQACKDAGINLVSTNVSDARAEFMKLDFDTILSAGSWNWYEWMDNIASLFLVGLKFKYLTSYQWGVFMTMSARLEEENVPDYLPSHLDYEEDLDEIYSYYITACKNILRQYTKSDIMKTLVKYSREYDIDKDDTFFWSGLVQGVMTSGSNFDQFDVYFETYSLILGKMYEILSNKGLSEHLIIQLFMKKVFRVNEYVVRSSSPRCSYDNTLRPYILDEDPKYKDTAVFRVMDESTLSNLFSNFKNDQDLILTEDELDELLDEDPDDYEDELEDENDEEDDEETEYEIEMKAIEASENTVSNSCQSVKLETEPESSPISVEQKVKSQPTKIEIPDYNGLTVVSNLIKVAESDSLRNDHMQGLFTIGMNENEIKLLIDITGGIYLEKEVLDRLGKEYIKDVLIRFTTPNGSYSEDLEFFNKWNKVVGFLKMMDI